jgi:hypothetical protein
VHHPSQLPSTLTESQDKTRHYPIYFSPSDPFYGLSSLSSLSILRFCSSTTRKRF